VADKDSVDENGAETGRERQVVTGPPIVSRERAAAPEPEETAVPERPTAGPESPASSEPRDNGALDIPLHDAPREGSLAEPVPSSALEKPAMPAEARDLAPAAAPKSEVPDSLHAEPASAGELTAGAAEAAVRENLDAASRSPQDAVIDGVRAPDEAPAAAAAAGSAADVSQRSCDEPEAPAMRAPFEAVQKDWLVVRIASAAAAHVAALPAAVAERASMVARRLSLTTGPAAGAAASPRAPRFDEGAGTRSRVPLYSEPRGAAPVRDEVLGVPRDAPDFERRKAEARYVLTRAARYVGYAVAGYLSLVVVLIALYRFVDPPGSPLMLFHGLGGGEVRQSWVPLERISPQLVRAVVVAEDGRFCDHWGIDLQAMEQAIEQAADGVPRGASTISMQVTKNMFLWPSKSYLRKAIELPLTVVVELAWPKWRILEVYLNVAEWGPGVFGAEAAAHYHFNKPASRLGEREAALLAASLPNPVRRDAGDPGPRTSRKAGLIQARVRAAGSVAACVIR